mgnify:CR=1 FL=1
MSRGVPGYSAMPPIKCRALLLAEGLLPEHGAVRRRDSEDLLAVQRDHNKAIAEERRESKPKGLAAFLADWAKTGQSI